MEQYNDFATVADEKVGEFKKAYQKAMNVDKVEILRGDASPNENNDTSRFIGNSPVTNPINNEPSSSPVNSPSTTPNQSNNNSPSIAPKAKSNSLNQFNLLLFIIMLELIYGNGGNGSSCSRF